MGRSFLAAGVGSAVLFGAALLAAQEDPLVRPAPSSAPVSLPATPPDGATSRLETAVFALG